MRTSEPFRMAFVQMTVCSMQHETVQAANASIPTSEQIGDNQKGVNEVYLATIGKDVDDFTTTQVDDLFSIANQCPMLGGNAVFKARSLYSLINDDHVFDDQLLCLPHGVIVKNLVEDAANAIAVVPNPANEEATLVLGLEQEEPVTFILFNTVGKEVMRFMVPAHTLRFPFSTAPLAPAYYHYQVSGPSGVLGSGQLVIIR